MDNLIKISIPAGWKPRVDPQQQRRQQQTVSMDEAPEISPEDAKIERWMPWKDSPYQVSDMGRVRRVEQSGAFNLRKPRDDSRGHWRYNLTWTRDGVPYREEPFIHQMVMELFGPPKPSGDHIVILHGRDDGHDNRLSNLTWGTRSDNVEEAWDDGHIPRPSSG